MPPSKVVHIASGDGWGGAERVLSILLPELARREDLQLEVVLLNEGQLSSMLRRENVPIRILDESRLPPIALLRELRGATAAAHVVHAHRYKEIALASLVMRRGQRLVVTIHGLQTREQLDLPQVIKIWGTLWLARSRGSTFATVSNELSGRLRRGLRTRAVVQIPNPLTAVAHSEDRPIDIRHRFGWDSSRPVVGYAGRLEAVKGPDLLLAAAEALDERVAIAFLGAGSLRDQLHLQCQSRNLSSRVGFLGEVPDARPYLAQFDALAVPSRHEGIPMIILEAAEAGLPVAAFNVGGISELLTDPIATRLVPPSDTHALAAALESLMATPTASRVAARRWGAHLSARFSPASIVASYVNLYRSLS